MARRETIRGRDYDGLEAELLQLARASHWRWMGFSRGAGAAKATLRAERDAVQAHLLAFVDAVGADLAPRLRDELWPVVESYERLKESAGRLDFLDLLLIARDLLRGNPTVRRDLQGRFTHVFVDEFQDTDPLQAEILLLLAADDPDEVDWTRVRPVSGKLFLVGDPKQSIYRFRRADVALYEDVKRRLLDAGAVLAAFVGQLPRRARDPGGGERGVRAAHGRLRQPGHVRAARADPRQRRGAAGGGRAAGPGAVRRLRQGRRLVDRATRSPT